MNWHIFNFISIYFVCVSKSQSLCEIGELEVVLTQTFDKPRDIRLQPGSNQLWVANEGSDSMSILNVDFLGRMVLERNLKDDLAFHFMDQVSSFAFNDDGRWFASCQESNNNYNDMSQPGNGFMGPTLWKSSNFAKINQYGEEKWIQRNGKTFFGSHYDMNHEAPFCTGIEFFIGNKYWAIDGSGKFRENLMMFDFEQDHGPGGDDHSTATVLRYRGINIARVDRISSHMRRRGPWLYIADTGNNRVIRYRIGSGNWGKSVPQPWPEDLEHYNFWENGHFEIVFTGVNLPSALFFLSDEVFLVGSYETGTVYEVRLENLDGQTITRHTKWPQLFEYGLQSLVVHNGALFAVNSITNSLERAPFSCSGLDLSLQQTHVTPTMVNHPFLSQAQHSDHHFLHISMLPPYAQNSKDEATSSDDYSRVYIFFVAIFQSTIWVRYSIIALSALVCAYCAYSSIYTLKCEQNEYSKMQDQRTMIQP